jgi:hypothetical protein
MTNWRDCEDIGRGLFALKPRGLKRKEYINTPESQLCTYFISIAKELPTSEEEYSPFVSSPRSPTGSPDPDDPFSSNPRLSNTSTTSKQPQVAFNLVLEKFSFTHYFII